jgi:hypothetical protein
VLQDSMSQTAEEGDPSAAAQDATDETPEMAMIPYFECYGRMVVLIAIDGNYYPALFDTGAAITTFTDNFVEANPGSFRASGESMEWMGILSNLTGKVYQLQGTIKLAGITLEDDLLLQGKITAAPGYYTGGNETGAGVPGDPSSLPYDRGDLAGFSPVADIGLDLINGYDFMIDQAHCMLYFWKAEDSALLIQAG